MVNAFAEWLRTLTDEELDTLSAKLAEVMAMETDRQIQALQSWLEENR